MIASLQRVPRGADIPVCRFRFCAPPEVHGWLACQAGRPAPLLFSGWHWLRQCYCGLLFQSVRASYKGTGKDQWTSGSAKNAARWAALVGCENRFEIRSARSRSPGNGLGQPAAEESLPAKSGQREGVCDAVCAGAELRLVVDQRCRRYSYRTKDVITLVRRPLRGGSRRTLLAAAAATSLNRLRFPRATSAGRFAWFLTAASATARFRLARIPNLPTRIGRRHDCRQASRSDHYAQQKMGCGDSKHASVLVLVLVVGYLQSFRQKGAESSCGQQFPAERTP